MNCKGKYLLGPTHEVFGRFEFEDELIRYKKKIKVKYMTIYNGYNIVFGIQNESKEIFNEKIDHCLLKIYVLKYIIENKSDLIYFLFFFIFSKSAEMDETEGKK